MQSVYNNLYIYRVIDKNKVWNTVTCSCPHSITNYGIVEQEVQKKCAITGISIDTNTISELTNEYDIDFNEIYEGDIVEFTYYGKQLTGIVAWHTVNNVDNTLVIYCNCNQYDFHSCSYVKIIGNIYENIELLQSGDADVNTNADVLSKHLPVDLLEMII